MAMKCDEIQERFVDLLYEERGNQAVEPELRAHLDSCPRCRKELSGLARVRDELAKWRDEEPLRQVLVPGRQKVPSRFTPWTVVRYAATAAMIVLTLLALTNAEISWNSQGFRFSTQLVSREPSGPEYYSKAELRDLIKRALDDSESRMIQANYEMIQRMMDTVEQERWQDLRLVRRSFLPNSNKN